MSRVERTQHILGNQTYLIKVKQGLGLNRCVMCDCHNTLGIAFAQSAGYAVAVTGPEEGVYRVAIARTEGPA